MGEAEQKGHDYWSGELSLHMICHVDADRCHSCQAEVLLTGWHSAYGKFAVKVLEAIEDESECYDTDEQAAVHAQYVADALDKFSFIYAEPEKKASVISL